MVVPRFSRGKQKKRRAVEKAEARIGSEGGDRVLGLEILVGREINLACLYI